MKNIYDLLKEEHDEVKEMLVSLEKEIDFDLLKKLDETLTLHTEAEEKTFYEPLQKKLGDLSIIIEAANQEHEIASDLLRRALGLEDEEEIKPLVAIAKKSVEAHIKTEESDVFSLAKKHLTNKEAQEMAERFKEKKSKL